MQNAFLKFSTNYLFLFEEKQHFRKMNKLFNIQVKKSKQIYNPYTFIFVRNCCYFSVIDYMFYS